MNIRKFAGIDIGSNGVRLLIANVLEQEGNTPIFAKNSLVRVPIRLGADVFSTGMISQENQQRLLQTIQAYQLLMQVNKVETFRACATSAMREAKNGIEIVHFIFEKTGIKIDIISGSEEAEIIANTDLHQFIDSKKNYIYIDVGGGSTEFTIYKGETRVAAKSFPIGGVRLLKGLVSNDLWEEIKKWIQTHTQALSEIQAVGSGGNINRIFKDSRNKKGEPISLKYLENYFKEISKYSFDERVSLLGFNPDRADVITHAAIIYIKAMKWAGAKTILVPKVGLSDGIVKSLYRKVSEEISEK